jgi:hypothetical protein
MRKQCEPVPIDEDEVQKEIEKMLLPKTRRAIWTMVF